MYSEIFNMSSHSCSQLYSEFKALCEACRLSRSDDSSGLALLPLSLFCLASIWKCLRCIFSHLVFFLLILFIHTQPYAYMAYLQNKLWTIETQHCLILLPINQLHPVALSYISNAGAIHAHCSQYTAPGQHSFKNDYCLFLWYLYLLSTMSFRVESWGILFITCWCHPVSNERTNSKTTWCLQNSSISMSMTTYV